MHGFLADQHVSLIKKHHLHSSDSISPQITQMFTPDQMSNTHKYRTPIGFDVASSSDSDFESFMSINKLLVSPVNDESLKIKETKSREVLLKKISNLEDELVNLNKKLQSLEEENTNLKLVITDSNFKVKTMGEELLAAEDEISNLKIELSSKIFEQTHWLQGQLGSTQQEIALLHKQLDSEKDKNLGLQEEVYSYVADISIRNDQITELATKIDHFMSEISRLKSTQETEEDFWNADIARLKMEIREKCVSVDYLNKKMDELMLEKDGVKAELDTIQAEKCHQANIIQELESRLNSLQFEHVRVVSSFDNAQKVTNELSLKVVELEEEVIRQKEVSLKVVELVELEEEVIRQKEHYMSGYKQLCKAFVCNKRRAVFT